MHVYRFPPQRDKDYFVLESGKSKTFVANLHRAYAIGVCYFSIQAVTSGSVDVEVFKSNMFSTDPDDFIWMPCESINKFSVNAGDNFWLQGELKDVCGFLMFKFTSKGDEDIAVSCNFCLNNRLNISLKAINTSNVVIPSNEPEQIEEIDEEDDTVEEPEIVEPIQTPESGEEEENGSISQQE